MVDAYTRGGVGHVGVALSFAFVVTAMVYALGHVSGAHINPAVTVAFWSVRRFPLSDVVPYVAAQCAGATMASLILMGILGPAGKLGATLPAVEWHKAFLVEWLLSFVLMLVIMAVATDDRVPQGIAGVAVGLTVGFCALMGGPLTGASMNPARSLGPAIVASLWMAHWLYWVAPITGMIAAAWTYNYLRFAGPAPEGAEPLGIEGPIYPEGEPAGNLRPPPSPEAPRRRRASS